MTPLLERAIRAGCVAVNNGEGKCAYPTCDCTADPNDMTEALAKEFIAAALADDEATVEAMARRACIRRGFDPDGPAYCGNAVLANPAWQAFRDEAIGDLAALRRHSLGD